VHSDDRRLKVMDQVAGVFARVSDEIDQKVRGFSYDLKPLLDETYQRVRKPLHLPMGDAGAARSCACSAWKRHRSSSADGIEKDFALVGRAVRSLFRARRRPKPSRYIRSRTWPWCPRAVHGTIPVVASYAEPHARPRSGFNERQMFFLSAEHPKLYLEKPELYESSGALVLRLHIAGPVHEFGIDADINGDLYLVGHPTPDRQRGGIARSRAHDRDWRPISCSHSRPMDRTASASRPRRARPSDLDLTERLQAVKKKLSADLSFGSAQQCFVGTWTSSSSPSSTRMTRICA